MLDKKKFVYFVFAAYLRSRIITRVEIRFIYHVLFFFARFWYLAKDSHRLPGPEALAAPPAAPEAKYPLATAATTAEAAADAVKMVDL